MRQSSAIEVCAGRIITLWAVKIRWSLYRLESFPFLFSFKDSATAGETRVPRNTQFTPMASKRKHFIFRFSPR